MANKLAIVLIMRLMSLSFITKGAGVYHLIKKPIADNKFLRLPAAKVIYRQDGHTDLCTEAQPYFDLVPNSNEAGIVFFEDLGAKLESRDRIKACYKGTLRLICWLNLKKTGDNVTTELAQNWILDALGSLISADGYFIAGSIKVSQIDPKRPDPFEKFDFNEAQKQFLSTPYDYFSMQISYKVFVPRYCTPVAELNPTAC